MTPEEKANACVDLKPAEEVAASNRQIADCLRATLALAEKGELSSVLLLTVARGGVQAVSLAVVGSYDTADLVYKLELAKHEILSVDRVWQP